MSVIYGELINPVMRPIIRVSLACHGRGLPKNGGHLDWLVARSGSSGRTSEMRDTRTGQYFSATVAVPEKGRTPTNGCSAGPGLRSGSNGLQKTDSLLKIDGPVPDNRGLRDNGHPNLLVLQSGNSRLQKRDGLPKNGQPGGPVLQTDSTVDQPADSGTGLI